LTRLLFIWSLLFITWACAGQELPPITQQQLEDLAETTDEEPNDDNFLQQLEYFRRNPINLNTATIEELQAIRFLNDLQIASLLRYRSLLGNLVSIYELQSVPGWDPVTIRRILPYVKVTASTPLKETFLSRFQHGDQSLLVRISRVLEKSKGYDTALNTHYLGDRNHLMFRYRYQYKDLLYFGLTSDKDAGEQFFRGAQSKGFDFYSFHLFARKLGIIQSIALGDYTVNLGQGLIQWQGLAFGKSAEAISIKRQSPVLTPYRSAGEFYFNRGVGMTLQKGSLQSTLFASFKKISGNLITDSVEHFSSLITSGYYRTPSEIADRNNVGLTSWGGNLAYHSASFRIGLNAVSHHFDLPFEKRDEPYNLYAIRGKRVFNSSVDYSYTYKNIHLFGEGALDKAFHRAFISGALVSVDQKMDVSLLYRDIQQQYQSLSGNAFTENSTPVGEKGLYTGVVLRPAYGWQLNAYADLFRFPWLRYLVNAPSSGHEYLAQLNYQPNKTFGFYVRFRNKNKPTDESAPVVIYYPQDRLKQNLRIHLFQQLSPAFSVNTRFELLWFNRQSKASEQGFLSYVDGKYDGKRLSAGIRLQYFETNSYDSRIYVYESDVLYSFSIPAFYNKGFRYCLNIHYRVAKNFGCYLRLAQTVYTDKTLIGSGLDEIEGNTRTDLKLQLSYLF
jgi:hypothetical protein